MTTLSLITLFIFILTGQNKSSHYSIGKTHTIKSKILEQERELYIYLPESYHKSDKKYPVLYILDGQRFFLNGVAIQQSLRSPDIMPKHIIVGISSIQKQRRKLFWNGRETYLSFLEKEVITFVESNYKAKKERILFGWEAAAYFSNYALLDTKEIFDAAIITNGAYASDKMLEEFNHVKKEKYLYISNSDKDIFYVESSNNFAKKLEKKKPKRLTWKYEKFNDEIHQTLPNISLYSGLKYYYNTYPSLIFSSISKFENFGGIPVMTKYFQKRAKRFGFPERIDNSTKDGLIWLAWNKNNFKYFELFMEEFKDVLSTKRYASSYWQNRFGQFYLKHKKYDKAIEYFMNGLNKYDKTAKIYHGLGNAYLGKNLKEKAKANFKKAVKIAKEKSDKNLAKYENDLSKLNARR